MSGRRSGRGGPGFPHPLGGADAGSVATPTAFLYAGVQGPLPVLRLIVPTCTCSALCLGDILPSRRPLLAKSLSLQTGPPNFLEQSFHYSDLDIIIFQYLHCSLYLFILVSPGSIGNVQIFLRLGPQHLVWAHNSGLEMFKFCYVWAHNFLSGHIIPD